MPPVKDHIRSSFIRTGKEYKELHEWVEGYHSTKEEKEDRHDIVKIPKFLPFVKKRFGEIGTQEYLYHIKEDYEKSRAYKLAKIIAKLKFW